MKNFLGILLLLLLVWLGWKFFFPSLKDSRESFSALPKNVTVIENGETLVFQQSTAQTVEDFLKNVGFTLSEEDNIFPSLDDPLRPEMSIFFTPARSVDVLVDGKKETFSTTAKTTEEILSARNITLDEDDIVKPLRGETVPTHTKITVTRVLIQEEHKDMPIPFATKTIEDDKLSWRKTIVQQKGENGIKRTTYRVAYYDGKEVNRHVLSVETTKEPVGQVMTQGTYVKVGKSHTGGASWYAYTGTLSAANPWLPFGSYVRVTNTENGKSVIVKINDRGPFGPGRIIDLDKVAFAKIASLGTGVINVKMEEIVN